MRLGKESEQNREVWEVNQIDRILNEISLMSVEEWMEFHRAYTEKVVKPVLEKMGAKSDN
jgi:hypothetical protein